MLLIVVLLAAAIFLLFAVVVVVLAAGGWRLAVGRRGSRINASEHANASDRLPHLSCTEGK